MSDREPVLENLMRGDTATVLRALDAVVRSNQFTEIVLGEGRAPDDFDRLARTLHGIIQATVPGAKAILISDGSERTPVSGNVSRYAHSAVTLCRELGNLDQVFSALVYIARDKKDDKIK